MKRAPTTRTLHIRILSAVRLDSEFVDRPLPTTVRRTAIRAHPTRPIPRMTFPTDAEHESVPVPPNDASTAAEAHDEHTPGTVANSYRQTDARSFPPPQSSQATRHHTTNIRCPRLDHQPEPKRTRRTDNPTAKSLPIHSSKRTIPRLPNQMLSARMTVLRHRTNPNRYHRHRLNSPLDAWTPLASPPK